MELQNRRQERQNRFEASWLGRHSPVVAFLSGSAVFPIMVVLLAWLMYKFNL